MEQEERKSMIPFAMRAAFGVFMIVIYVGMGVLLLINFFDWQPGAMQWLRWGGGVMFILYGIWRAIRQFRGIDTPL